MVLNGNKKLQQAITTHQEDKLEEAESLYRSLLETDPKNLSANNNLGILLYSLGRFSEAEKCYKKATELKPDFADAYNNLGITLKKLKKYDEAEKSFNKAIELQPDVAGAPFNLGNMLKDLRRFDEAETSFNKAIELKPDYAEAYNNLGNVLRDLKRLDEAEISYRKAIELKPDYAEAYTNLGHAIYSIDNLIALPYLPDEAEACCRKAIELKPDFAEGYNTLGIIMLTCNRLNEAEKNFKKAVELKPDYAEARYNLHLTLNKKQLLDIQQKRKLVEKTKFNFLYKIFRRVFNLNSNLNKFDSGIRLTSNPFISNKRVESKFLPSLYKINYKNPDQENIKKSSDFNLFEDDSPIIKNLAKDLENIMKQAVKSDIFISESFFNIWKKDDGIVEHTHITDFDKINGLVDQKFSLTYYLSVGDQDCTEPGYLKLYNPDKKILPTEGMIAIFPASRKHSAVYNGKTDRVMIGINFYSLL